MFKVIVAATDGSPLGTLSVVHAAQLASAFRSRLVIVTVTEETPTFFQPDTGWSMPTSVFNEVREANAERSRAILDAAEKAGGVRAEKLHIEDRQPFQGILDAANEVGADTIVMGSHGHRGLQRLILGSQASKVLSLAEVPVVIVKDPRQDPSG